MKFDWAGENTERAMAIIEKWMIENRCSSGETAQQSDECTINAIYLVSDLADLLVISDESDYE